MADIWHQFHQLPRSIRDAVATSPALATVDELEQQYPQLDVAGLIMRVMVKEVAVNDLTDAIAKEGNLDPDAAEGVATKLKTSVFQSVGDFLGLQEVPAPEPKPDTAPNTTTEPVPPTPAPPTPSLRPLGQPDATSPKPPPAPPSEPPKPSLAPTPKPPSLPSSPIPKPPSVPAEPDTPIGDAAPTQAYSDDDAKEIEQQAKRLKQFTAHESAMDFVSLAKEVIKRHQLDFADELLRNRAVAIIKARLKGIRDSAGTVDMLTRDPKIGGLGLDQDLAQQVIANIDTKATDLKKRGMVKPPQAPQPPAPPKVPTVRTEKPEPKPPLQTTLPPDNLPVAPEPTPSMTEPPRPSRPIKRPPDIPPPSEVKTETKSKASSPAPAPRVQRSRVIDRPSLSDIQKPSRTYGPAEEMRSMTVAEFRRLGQGANDSAGRLLEKFSHLQNESFRMWADALAGWRQSELYQLYLSMGRESLEENQPIRDIIKRRASSNQPYISEHEFSALADLNRQLQP